MRGRRAGGSRRLRFSPGVLPMPLPIVSDTARALCRIAVPSIIAVSLVTACGKDNKTEVAKPPVDVTVMTTAARDVPVAPVYVAQTQSSQAVNIQARVSSFAAVADGTYLNPQNSQLTTVSVLTPMWINFSVSENEMERIRDQVKRGLLKLPDGSQFVVEIEMVDGSIFPFKGRITFADPSYNSATGTFLLRATVDNPDGVLRPNQYVRTRLVGAVLPNAIVVPQRAVQQSAEGHFVWVVNKDNKAELRPVDVGDWTNDDWV